LELATPPPDGRPSLVVLEPRSFDGSGV